VTTERRRRDLTVLARTSVTERLIEGKGAPHRKGLLFPVIATGRSRYVEQQTPEPAGELAAAADGRPLR